MNPKPKGIQLPVSVDGCSRETFIKVTSDVWMAASKRNYTVDYWPEYSHIVIMQLFIFITNFHLFDHLGEC